MHIQEVIIALTNYSGRKLGNILYLTVHLHDFTSSTSYFIVNTNLFEVLQVFDICTRKASILILYLKCYDWTTFGILEQADKMKLNVCTGLCLVGGGGTSIKLLEWPGHTLLGFWGKETSGK